MFIFKNPFILFSLIGILAYLIGCINSSIIVTKIFKSGNDIRKLGSGNPGFTNVLRTMGKKMAIFTFIGDFAKGVLAVGLGKWIALSYFSGNGEELFLRYALYISGLACILGHIYPCFFKFKGGKGVLTTWATTLLMDWRIFVIIITVFLVVLICTKIVSLSSLIAAISYPIATFLTLYFGNRNGAFKIDDVILSTNVSLIISVIVIYKHKENIKRLFNHTEKRISVHK